MRYATRGVAQAHSSFERTTRGSIRSSTAWLAAAVPIGIGTALAAVIALFAQLGQASIVNGRLDVLGTAPIWWAVARLAIGVLLILGVTAGVAAATRVARDFVDRRQPSARRAWRETLAAIPLLMVVAVVASLGGGAIALGASTALALVGPLVVVGLLVVAILVVVGVAILAPLTLALPVDALEGGGVRALPRTFVVAKRYSQMTRGRARPRATLTLLLGLAVADLAISAPWGGSLLPVALVTFGVTIAVVAWAVLAAGIWTGVAADGLEALDRLPVEGSWTPVPGAPRRLLLAVGALALAPVLTAGTLAIDPIGVPRVEAQNLARVPIGGPEIAPFGDGGVAVLSMRGVSGFGADLSLCRSGGCRTLELPDVFTIAMSSTPEGDLVFAHWRRTPAQPELVLTRLTPSEVDALVDDLPGKDEPDHRVDSRYIGEDDGPGATVVIARYDGEFPDSYNQDVTGQHTTMVAVDATGSTPVVASLEAFPKVEEHQSQNDQTPTLSVYRCEDAACTSASTVGATSLTWSPAVNGTGPTLFDMAADDDRAAVGLSSYSASDEPIRLFTFADGTEPTVSSIAEPVPDTTVVSDDNAGLSVALRPDGLATLLWRLPTTSSFWLSSCLDERCTDSTDVEIDPGLPTSKYGPPPALAIDSSGRPLVAVATPDDTLALIDCLDAACQEMKRTELIDIVWHGAPIGLALDGDRPILIADGADPTPSTLRLPSQVVRCLEARCG